ncbi:RHS repeat-associated core domain protein containing protein [Herbaspirillum sp. CF444]|uniref:RHS repeat-associated core domain-containing protein n=1 Tax=Herbaspirillum sp. CF444 TaxID=1144319 RepID=UPI0002726E69|nr:RHS repeat-associated core domain-containing protein [Herbaspirillum sp. CF444]EJL88515.1 RHS repeat-associated core domain protein containing protein [Herbaspirillum sp. CF444]
MEMAVGYNGQRQDPLSGTYHLGNGYRAYNPVLMRFNCPDSWSPFGAGGINPYAYCAGDPINQADPSGHMSTGQWIGLGLGLVAGIALSIATEGAALPAVLSLAATVTGDAAIGAVAESVAEAVDGQRVDWVSVGWAAGLGGAGSLIGWGGGKMAIKATAGLRTRLGNLMHMGLSGRGASAAGAAMAENVVIPTASLEGIPPEAFNEIAFHLNGRDLQALAETSRTLHANVLGYEDLQFTGITQIRPSWVGPNTRLVRQINGRFGLIRIEELMRADPIFAPIAYFRDTLRWAQATVMGRAPYRARLVLSRGIPHIGLSGEEQLIRFHPRSLFHARFFPEGAELSPEDRLWDHDYATYLNQHMPEPSEYPVQSWRSS